MTSPGAHGGGLGDFVEAAEDLARRTVASGVPARWVAGAMLGVAVALCQQAGVDPEEVVCTIRRTMGGKP